MSIEALRSELQNIIETSDYDKLLTMREAVLEKEKIPNPDSENWWNELPDHVQQNIDLSLRQSRAGLGIPHEEMVKMYPRWFRRLG